MISYIVPSNQPLRQALVLCYTKGMIIAVDTGGTKTLVAAFSDEGAIKEEIKFPTPKNKKEWVRQLRQAIEDITHEARIDVIVVAIPGIVKSGVAIWCNHLLWANYNVQAEIEAQFPGVPVLVENDANLGGLGEVRRLKNIPSSALYVTISTGIGTGFISNGVIDPGLRLSEGGRSLIEYNGVVQEWEMFGAGSSVYAAYGKFARDIHSKRIWKQIADRFSRGFLAIIPLAQPDVIIIGGSMGTYFDRYEEALLGILREKMPPHIPVPKFSKAKDAEKAVIYGCYFYGSDWAHRDR